MWFIDKIREYFKQDLSRPYEPIVSLGEGKFDYLINDPTTPELRTKITPPKTDLDFRVLGFTGKPGNELSDNSYITISNGIYVTQKAGRPIPNWASKKPLNVLPKAQQGLNAYYDRQNLVFFFGQDPKTKKIIYTANSSDIVAHELGHALLDAQRPDFWNTQAPEIWAFHEAYADITAICHLMQYDEVLEYALKETEGDLRKSNVISRLAEEMGNAIYHLTGGHDGRKPGALRDAVNNFLYAPPNKLPKNAPENKLSSECHSYGRVFLGTWYSILVELYEYEKGDKTAKSIKSLRIARDKSFRYLRHAVQVTGRVSRYHQALAQAMLLVAEPPYKKIMKNVFKQRRILKPQIKILSKTDVEIQDIISAAEHVEHTENGTSVRIAPEKTIKLSNYIPEGFVSNLSINDYDLADLEIEVANESYYEFDKKGNLVFENVANIKDIINDARLCALMIQKNNSVGPEKDKMWEVQKGKLIRTFIE
jgi:hypothetical protein